MAVSMTGYGRGGASTSLGTVTAEIRSVNSRFLELNFRSDGVSPAMEDMVRTLVKETIIRGKVSVSLKFAAAMEGRAVQAEVDTALLSAQLEALRKAQNLPGVKKEKLSAADLLAVPAPWLRVSCDPVSDEELAPLVRQAAEEALAGLRTMREKEGRNLAEDLLGRLRLLREGLQLLKDRQQPIIEQYEARLRSRIEALLASADAQADEGRILEEVAVYAEKTDYTEELVRFESHLDQFEKTLAGSGPVGRKLDFLLQEINREINTAASKASDLAVVDCVIQMKTELEKIREQVQNLE